MSAIEKLSVQSATLDPAPIPPEDVVSGEPEAAWAVMWRSQDGCLFNGVWHCTPGTFYLDHPPDETVCLIEGHATVTPEGDESVELRAGDTAFMPAGMRARWEVHQTVRKSFHAHDASGKILAGVDGHD